MFRNTLRTALPVARAGTVRYASTTPISKPLITDLQSRWEGMTSEEQQDIVSLLAERQKGSWKDLTLAEKQAAWYIEYGPWGPRKPVHAEGDGAKIAGGVALGLAAAVALFAAVRMAAGEKPKTMTKEWQEASNEILKEKNANPFSTYDQIQSPSSK